MAGVTIAPLVHCEAVSQQATLALAGARQRARPVIHLLVLSRHPPAKRVKYLGLGHRSVQQPRPLAVITKLLDTGVGSGIFL